MSKERPPPGPPSPSQPEGAVASRRDLLGALATAGTVIASAGRAGPAAAQSPAPATPAPSAATPAKPNRKLLLGAGGIKGAFQAGAIRRLLESGFRPDVIYGTSAGALNGAFLADRASFLGQARRSYFQALGKPLPPRIDGDAPVDWPFIGDQLTAFWRDNVTEPRSLIRRRTVRSALSLLFQRFDGIYDTAPLKALIAATIDGSRILSAKVPFGVVATNVDTGQAEFLFHGQDGMDIRDAVLASAAMPVAFPIVEIDSSRGRQRYCDGAVRETVPVTLATLERTTRPATHVVAIVTQPPRSVLGRLEQPGNVMHVLARQIDIVSEEIVSNDLAVLKRSGIRQIVIRPDQPVNRDQATRQTFEIDNFKRHHIEEMIHRGAWYAKHVLDQPAIRFAEDGFRDA